MDTSLLYFGQCVKCNKEVHGAGKACQAMGQLFHDSCFTCSLCSKRLQGKPFYTMAGSIYCEEDFLHSGVHPPPEVCNSCGHLIMDMVLQAHGKSYHSACFRCVVCRQNLEDQPFTVSADDKVYCVMDYHKAQAPCCASCNKPILPTEGCTESIRVVSFNNYYHVDCYGCDVDFV
ncbi:LIM domain-containing protein 1-like isoform X2 [Dunckerocampus dactyliophorus]|uniref:LIM domain-containing protein 1-like isoform X2 n=1 Tax=Dunckerocampus dactyliophorus TaxID=161453 RepID=UPI0024065C33|nr:LIM domain-containing protein 1-like isoform X2 [Dunckerocampus dactyliophorus]